MKSSTFELGLSELSFQDFKLFRYSFSQTIPIIFDRLKKDFIFVRSNKIDITMTTINKKTLTSIKSEIRAI